MNIVEQRDYFTSSYTGHITICVHITWIIYDFMLLSLES